MSIFFTDNQRVKEWADKMIKEHLPSLSGGFPKNFCYDMDDIPPEIKEVADEMVKITKLSVKSHYQIFASVGGRDSGFKYIPKEECSDTFLMARIILHYGSYENYRLADQDGLKKGVSIKSSRSVTLSEGNFFLLDKPDCAIFVDKKPVREIVITESGVTKVMKRARPRDYSRCTIIISIIPDVSEEELEQIIQQVNAEEEIDGIRENLEWGGQVPIPTPDGPRVGIAKQLEDQDKLMKLVEPWKNQEKESESGKYESIVGIVDTHEMLSRKDDSYN